MLADASGNRGAYEVVAVVAREEEERVVRHALPAHSHSCITLAGAETLEGCSPGLGSELVRGGN